MVTRQVGWDLPTRTPHRGPQWRWERIQRRVGAVGGGPLLPPSAGSGSEGPLGASTHSPTKDFLPKFLSGLVPHLGSLKDKALSTDDLTEGWDFIF